MKKIAFKMQLFPGNVEEYKKRHDEIWPELTDLLHQHGVSDYSIFLDESTGSLFGVLSVIEEAQLSELPKTEIMQKWWTYMADIMETNADNSPLSVPLKNVFYMA
jgi:L-rhamnose mutarotase